MCDELLDVIDDNGCVINTLPFAEVHERGLLHQFTRVLVIDSGGLFVLQRIASHLKDAGKVDCHGGHVTSGDTCKQTAVRELAEEIGINVSEQALEPLGKIQFKTLYENMIGEAYFTTHDGPYKIVDGEVSEIFKISQEGLEKLINDSPEKLSLKLIQCFNLWKEKKCLRYSML